MRWLLVNISPFIKYKHIAYKNILNEISSYMPGLKAVKKQAIVTLTLHSALLSKRFPIPQITPTKTPIMILTTTDLIELLFNKLIALSLYLLKILKEAKEHRNVIANVRIELKFNP
jgi:hypothetical protein